MILATVTTTQGRTVELCYDEGYGYTVQAESDNGSWWEGPIPSRAKAEQRCLWMVGYPEWVKAGEKAYQTAREAWLKSHTDLASVNAEEVKP